MHALTRKQEGAHWGERSQGKPLGVLLTYMASEGLLAQFVLSEFGFPYCKESGYSFLLKNITFCPLYVPLSLIPSEYPSQSFMSNWVPEFGKIIISPSASTSKSCWFLSQGRILPSLITQHLLKVSRLKSMMAGAWEWHNFSLKALGESDLPSPSNPKIFANSIQREHQGEKEV